MSDALVEFIGIGGEGHLELGAAAEFHQEKFILCVGRPEKSGGCLGNFFHFVPHAAAGVQKQANGDRGVFCREGGDTLSDAVLRHTKIVHS